MRKLTHMDGRPISFDRHTVILVEPHESGTGTFVRFGPLESPRDAHIREEYDDAIFEIQESDHDRFVRTFSSGEPDQLAF